MRLPIDFYLQTDVVAVARQLIGKVLVTQFNGQRTSGLITETEAYRAPDDRACHAYGNRRTPRTSVMFEEGGRAYIYLCYGIHHLFNVVTAPEGMAHAVLIRAIQPIDGMDIMMQRRKKDKVSAHLTTGPGAMAQALGLTTAHTNQSFSHPDSPIWLEYPDATVDSPFLIGVGRRIGVEYAAECADWPWRFWMEGSSFYKKP
jgi:DNA-3-methyladenine glycosylase